MRPLALILALSLLAGPALAATEAEPEDPGPLLVIPEPVPVLAPIPSTGLSEDILDQMRERLTDQVPRASRKDEE